jgi:hypothetical protein
MESGISFQVGPRICPPCFPPGRGQVEKMLLAEAVHLFLGDGCLCQDNEQNFERKLQPGAIAALENQLKTMLDQKN